MMKPFLSARWTNLIVMSYAVSEATLAPYLPASLELDRWEGRAYASIVAFDFSDTHIRGMVVPPLPNVRDFAEINLRFYVKQSDRRGVVFVSEIVASPLVAGVARVRYNEPYSVGAIRRGVALDAAGRRLEEHTLTWRGAEQRVAVSVAPGEPETPEEDSFARWITDQSWGFGQTRTGRLTRYRVAHPTWRVLPVAAYENTLDFPALYGERWNFLTGRAPDSVLFVEGGPVSVYDQEAAGPKAPQVRK